MRKQLIIKIPEGTTREEMNAIASITTQSYAPGYPLFIFPGWEYEIVEVSEPMMIINDSKNNKEEFIKAMREAKLKVVAD